VIIVSDGDKSWRSVNGMVEPISREEGDAMRATNHPSRVAGLVDLLKDDKFTLTSLGASKLDGVDVDGVKVSYPGRPDVSVFFDRASGLLAGYHYRGKNPISTDKEVLIQWTQSGYRELTGLTEEQFLRKVGVKTDGESLLAFLRKSAAPGRVTRLRTLVRQLGDEAFAERERAQADLIKAGKPALAVLREALRSKDPEVVNRVKVCIKAIGDSDPDPAVVAVRLIAIRRPAGGVSALLDALADPDEEMVEEVRAALVFVAHRDGKPDPTLVKALTDERTVRRDAARAVLGKDGGEYLKRTGRRLFYRSGLQPSRTIHRVDGEVLMELEVIEAVPFNRFEDREFARP